MKVLNVEQIKYLQELGLKVDSSLLYYTKVNDEWTLQLSKNEESIPALALEDILSLLPDRLDDYDLKIDKVGGQFWEIYYVKDNSFLHHYGGMSLLKVAFYVLCEILENKSQNE